MAMIVDRSIADLLFGGLDETWGFPLWLRPDNADTGISDVAQLFSIQMHRNIACISTIKVYADFSEMERPQRLILRPSDRSIFLQQVGNGRAWGLKAATEPARVLPPAPRTRAMQENADA